jgi:hypothetical protein
VILSALCGKAFDFVFDFASKTLLENTEDHRAFSTSVSSVNLSALCGKAFDFVFDFASKTLLENTEDHRAF